MISLNFILLFYIFHLIRTTQTNTHTHIIHFWCKELLSKQDHYDWGLRAIKSVLVVAGSLKRGDPGRPEEEVLMRALRDFNIPKIVTDDMPVFMGLYYVICVFVSLVYLYSKSIQYTASVNNMLLMLMRMYFVFYLRLYQIVYLSMYVLFHRLTSVEFRFNFRSVSGFGCATQTRPRI